jgi:hypothetical protein
MRFFAFSLAALLLSACGAHDAPPPAQTASGCVRTASHQVLWTDSATPDTISTRAEGPTCAQAVVTFIARNAQGDPLWTFAATYYDMKIGGVAPADTPAVSPAQIDQFLAAWADVTAQHSNQLPEWREGAAAPGVAGQTLSYSSPFTRDVYEALRQHDLRMICYAAAVSATQCLVVDPSSNAPTMIVAYGS